MDDTPNPESTSSKKMDDTPNPESTSSIPLRKRLKKSPTCKPMGMGSADVNVRWSIRERTKLVDALKKYGVNNSVKIAEEVKTKSSDQVEYFIKGYSKKIRSKEDDVPYPENLPIDQWQRHVELILSRKHDYSQALIKAISNLSDEPFAGVYHYLTQLLTNEMPAPPESPYECAILSKLLQDLADYVMSFDLDHFHETLDVAESASSASVLENCDDDPDDDPSLDDFDRLYRNGFLESSEDRLSLNPFRISPLVARSVLDKGPAVTKPKRKRRK